MCSKYHPLVEMAAANIAGVALSTMRTSIDSSISELKRFKNPDSSLLTDYETIKKNVDSAIASQGNTSADALNAKVSDINIQLAALDTRKQGALPDTSTTSSSIIGATYSKTFYSVRFFTTLIGMLLGAIIGSHWFLYQTVNHDFLSNLIVYKLFFGFYGALLFPLALAYCVVSPPMWRASFLPLYQRDSDDMPSWIPGIFTYFPPSPEDTDSSKKILQILSGVTLAGLTAVFFLSGQTTVTLPSFLQPKA